jgi:4,5-DOPA dioxygenase extradiol
MMPIIFIGHGSPMNGIEDNEFARAWHNLALEIPKPDLILSISAHWVTKGTRITSNDRLKTIHDFYGFPKELYNIEYPASGAPKIAESIIEQVNNFQITPDNSWGLDHGTWIVLRRMYPKAQIPVIQLSLDYTRDPNEHFELGKELKKLRNQSVLILGSGNIVHNLGMMNPYTHRPYEWAMKYDELVKELLEQQDYPSIINYQKFGEIARLSIPTNEHYLPLLYILAASDKKDSLSFGCEKIVYGSVSMRCVILR